MGSIVPGEADRETGMGVDTMRTMLERKRKAEDAYLQANGRDILRAARHHRGYRTEFYFPKDLVFFWKEGRKIGGK